jgi:hypothetical protein
MHACVASRLALPATLIWHRTTQQSTTPESDVILAANAYTGCLVHNNTRSPTQTLTTYVLHLLSS